MLARRAGCHASLISHIERGQRALTPTLAMELDAALGSGNQLLNLALAEDPAPTRSSRRRDRQRDVAVRMRAQSREQRARAVGYQSWEAAVAASRQLTLVEAGKLLATSPTNIHWWRSRLH